MEKSSELPLNAREPRGINEHRGVIMFRPTQSPDAAGKDESAQGEQQARRQRSYFKINLVLDRQQIRVVLDMPDEPIGLIDEHCLCAEVVRRRIQAYDEVAGEKVCLKVVVFGLWIDEDIGKRRRRVADVPAAFKQCEQGPDLPVDASDFALVVGDVDGCVVGLVIDKQKRQINRLRRTAAVLAQPRKKMLQGARVLLDDEHSGLVQIAQGHADARGSCTIEVTPRVGERNGVAALVKSTNADGAPLTILLREKTRAISPDEPFVHALLRLISKTVVNASDDDDQSVAGVRGLADQARIVRCLAGLHMADDHASAIPRPGFVGVLEQAENSIGHFVERREHAPGQPAACQIFPIPVPVVRFDICARLGQPWPVLGIPIVDNRAHGHRHSVTGLELASKRLNSAVIKIFAELLEALDERPDPVRTWSGLLRQNGTNGRFHFSESHLRHSAITRDPDRLSWTRGPGIHGPNLTETVRSLEPIAQCPQFRFPLPGAVSRSH